MQYRLYVHTLVGTQVHTLTVYIHIMDRIQTGENFTSVLALCCKAHFFSPFFLSVLPLLQTKWCFLFSYEATKDSTYNLLPLAIT